MATARYYEARRENALKSTGPRTPQGKARSRVNAYKHGLAGEGVVLSPEARHAWEQRRAEIGARVDRSEAHTQHLEDQAALASVRVDLCQQALRRRVIERWDIDRREAATALGARLANEPELVSIQLDKTAQGVLWKVERFDLLLEQLRTKQYLKAEEMSLLLDLLGAPKIGRDSDQGFDPHAYRELILRERGRLLAWKAEVLDPVDEVERLEAELGVPHDQSREAQLYRRYERENQSKHYKICSSIGHEGQAGRGPAGADGGATGEGGCSGGRHTAATRAAGAAEAARPVLLGRPAAAVHTGAPLGGLAGRAAGFLPEAARGEGPPRPGGVPPEGSWRGPGRVGRVGAIFRSAERPGPAQGGRLTDPRRLIFSK
jgi:hypothetical protein